MSYLLYGVGMGQDVRVGQIRMAHLSHRVSEADAKSGRGSVKVEIMRIVKNRVTVKIVKTGAIIQIDSKGIRPMAEKKAMEMKMGELVAKFNNV